MIEEIDPPLSRDLFKKCIQTNRNKDIIIKCSASWCGPCRRIQPYFNEELNKYSINHNILYINIDFDKHSDLCSYLRIKSIPTILYYRNGELTSSFMGSNIEQFKSWFSKL